MPTTHGRRLPPDAGRLLLTWVALLALGAVEFGLSRLALGQAWRPLVLFPAILMIVLVAVSFMELGKGPTIVRAFAVAAAFWLVILLVLGSADPMTRTDHYVPAVTGVAEH